VLIGEVYLPLQSDLVASSSARPLPAMFNFALLSTLWSARSIEDPIIAD